MVLELEKLMKQKHAVAAALDSMETVLINDPIHRTAQFAPKAIFVEASLTKHVVKL